MIRELYRMETRETSLNVTQSHVDSVRRKQIVKSGCRVYENGFIGISGTLGEATDAAWAEAEANLGRQVPYPYAPEQNIRRQESRSKTVLDAKEFTRRTEALLERLRTAYPTLIFSNKVTMTETIRSLTNDAGLELQFSDCYYVVVLLAKAADSAAVFDTAAEYVARTFDVDVIFRSVSQILDAHLTTVPMPAGDKLALILEPYILMDPLDQALNGQMFYRDASLLSGKLGQKLFSEDLTLTINRTETNPGEAFFDAEGVLLPEDRCALIENGVLLRAYTDKKTAAEFGVEHTASAGGDYDDLPQLSAPSMEFASSGKTLEELLQGRPAALVVMASGGDCTPEGVFATPVQTAYLYQNGKLLGRLPEFNARGSLFDLLGQDYLGRSADKPFSGYPWLAVNAEVFL